MASERESIMDLIRNEYDPKPNLGRGDFPAFEWDDGAGRIADAILADQTLALRKLTDERDEMVKALEFYVNQWQVNGDGDSETPGLSRSWMEPTDELLRDGGRIASAILAKVKT